LGGQPVYQIKPMALRLQTKDAHIVDESTIINLMSPT